MTDHALEALQHAIGLFHSELRSQASPNLHVVIAQAPTNDHPRLYPGGALPPLPVNLQKKNRIDSFFIPLLPASMVHYFGESERLGRFRDLLRIALAALRVAFPDIDKLASQILYCGPQGDADHILADCPLLFLRDIVALSPSRRQVFERWFWMSDAANTRIPYYENDRRDLVLPDPESSEVDVTTFTSDAFMFVATALEFATGLPPRAVAHPDTDPSRPSVTPDSQTSTPKTSPVAKPATRRKTRDIADDFDTPPSRHNRHYPRIKRAGREIIAADLENLLRWCNNWLNMSGVARRCDRGKIAAAYVQGAVGRLKRRLVKLLRLYGRTGYLSAGGYSDLFNMLRREIADQWPSGLTKDHSDDLKFRLAHLQVEGGQTAPTSTPTVTIPPNNQSEPDALPQGSRSTPDSLTPGSKALAAAYELKSDKLRVSLKAACERAKVDRKHVRERYPEIVAAIRAIATPDGVIRRGLRDGRSGAIDAIGDDLE